MTEKKNAYGIRFGWAIPYFLIAAFVVILYSNALGHGFVFDDNTGIFTTPILARSSHLSQALLFFKEPWRQVTHFSYALTILIAGPNARAFHATNILIHLINSLLVFGIARIVARRWMPEDKVAFFSLAAALVHAAHPIYSEAVSYVWGRSSSLCATFYFSSLLFVMMGCEKTPGRRRFLYALAWLVGILAWMTKEEAITLPLIIAGFFALANSWRAAAFMALVPISQAVKIVHIYEKVQRQPLESAGLISIPDPLIYFLTHIKASVFYYLRMFVFPTNQCVDPYIKPVARPADPFFIAAVLVFLFLILGAVLSFRKHRAVSFGLMALVLSPLTAYALMPLADVVAEHRVYIAGLGFDILAAWILSRYPRYAYAALAVVLFVFGLAAYQRNLVWANSLSLWKDAEIKAPQLSRPHLNLGLAYQMAGRYEAALAEYRHALAVDSKLAPAYINMAGLYFAENNLDEAEAALNKATELSPLLSEPYMNLAVISLRRNQAAKALELIEKASSLDDSYLIHLNKGDVLFRLGRREDAQREYMRALELRPDLMSLKQEIDKRLHQLQGTGTIR